MSASCHKQYSSHRGRQSYQVIITQGKWRLENYPCFLSGSVQFFIFTLLFKVTLLVSSLWSGQWWGIFQLCCCCLFCAIVYTLGLNVSDQVRAGTAPVWERGNAEYALHEGRGLPAEYAQEWLTLLRHSPWLWLVVLIQERWIANQITATGWSHWQWTFTQLTCILFFCQIIRTILENMTKKLHDYSFNWI